MRRTILIIACLLALPLLSQAQEFKPLETVKKLDFKRYSGTWHEIARLPNRFEDKCVSDITADYDVLEDGQISVINRCRQANRKLDEVKGVGKLEDPSGPPSKLKVTFLPKFLRFLPFVWGDYQVISLAPDYSYSLVGTPDRDYLWILARSPNIDKKAYEKLINDAKAQGFDTTKLKINSPI